MKVKARRAIRSFSSNWLRRYGSSHSTALPVLYCLFLSTSNVWCQKRTLPLSLSSPRPAPCPAHICCGCSVASQFSSVTQSCPTLCEPMACSMPGVPVHHQLPELAQTHVHWVNDDIQPSSVTLFSCLQSFPASGSLPVSQLFTSGGQSTGASASVLPMNIQGWVPLGLIGLISLLSKGFSRVFSSTTVWKHQFFGCQTSLWSSSHIYTWLLEKT